VDSTENLDISFDPWTAVTELSFWDDAVALSTDA
jgi:hypothetical protein